MGFALLYMELFKDFLYLKSLLYIPIIGFAFIYMGLLKIYMLKLFIIYLYNRGLLLYIWSSKRFLY